MTQKILYGITSILALLFSSGCGSRDRHQDHRHSESRSSEQLYEKDAQFRLTETATKQYIQVDDKAGESDDKYSVMCPEGQSVVGVKYKDNDDDHLMGIYCHESGLTGDVRYEQLNNLSGSKYFRSCQNDEVVVGVYYDTKGDKQTLGFYCQKLSQFLATDTEYYQISGLAGDLYDRHCPETFSVSGFKYFDSGDDHIGGMYCKKNRISEPSTYKIFPLPLKYGHWQITQGNDSQTGSTHHGENKYSWDFELVDANKHFHPETGRDHKEDPDGNYSMGQTIYAVASGKLILGFKNPSDHDSSHIIVILHRNSPDEPYDGTRSIYDHIDNNGFLVGVGNRYDELASEYAGNYYSPGVDVVKGQAIGRIGYTGTPYPHLHFSVRDKYKNDETIPVRFDSYWTIEDSPGIPVQKTEGVPAEWEVIAPTEPEALNPSLP